MDTNLLFSRIAAVYEDSGLLAMCALCGRVRIDDSWLFPPRAALAAIDERGMVSYSICDGCLIDSAAALAEGHPVGTTVKSHLRLLPPAEPASPPNL